MFFFISFAILNWPPYYCFAFSWCKLSCHISILHTGMWNTRHLIKHQYSPSHIMITRPVTHHSFVMYCTCALWLGFSVPPPSYYPPPSASASLSSVSCPQQQPRPPLPPYHVVVQNNPGVYSSPQSMWYHFCCSIVLQLLTCVHSTTSDQALDKSPHTLTFTCVMESLPIVVQC